MILLPVDEAYALDYLAILQAKRDNGMDVEDELKRVETFLEAQLPGLRRVLASGAFLKLYQANRSTFDAIEKAHAGKITARRVQEINYARFAAKRKLQKRFWPQAVLAERKTKL